MTIERRVFWILTLSAFLALTSGCTRAHQRPIEVELARDGTGLLKDSGQKIAGYELHDGVHTDFTGWAKLTNQDSLYFWKSELVPESDVESASIIDDAKNYSTTPGPVLPLGAINYLTVVESSPVRTVLVVIGGVVVLAVVAAASAASNFKLTEIPD